MFYIIVLVPSTHFWQCIRESRNIQIDISISRAPLVPIFSFGENNTYDAQPVESRTMNYMNRLVYSKLKTRLPTVLRGRGILCSKGVFPYRRPINTIGKIQIDFISCSLLCGILF